MQVDQIADLVVDTLHDEASGMLNIRHQSQEPIPIKNYASN